jgi:hypothetical protein
LKIISIRECKGRAQLSMSAIPRPEELPTASTPSLSSLLGRLLELHSASHLQRLSEESQQAVVSLPEEDRPTTYEGLLDVARYCIDDAPGWDDKDKQVLVGGHPRIGAKGKISESSKAEQKADIIDAASDEKLARLNFIYEARYSSLKYVTYVAGRSRSAIATELEDVLGSRLADLKPPMPIDPEAPSADAIAWAQQNVESLPSTSQEWQEELNRGLDALFEIAMDRSSKIDMTEAAATERPKYIDEKEAFNVPFLTLDRFGKLVESSNLLSTFFKVDLPSSFYLVPPPPPQETPRELLATLAAVAVTGGGGGDATRKRVKGLLGGLWGEVADRAGKVTGRETRRGPQPAFGRAERLGGEELKAKGSKTGLLSPTTSTAAATKEKTNRDIENAEQNLKLATQRLTDVDRSHFVIDEPAMDASHDHIDDEEEGEDELEIGMDRLGIDEGVQIQSNAKAKDAETARGEFKRCPSSTRGAHTDNLQTCGQRRLSRGSMYHKRRQL